MVEQMSKKLDIIYFGDIKDINGVNLVTNLFLKGKNVFSNNGIKLRKIYSSTSTIDCVMEDSLPIGADLGTRKYKLTRIIRTVLRIIMDSRVPFFAWYKFKKNFLIPAQNVIGLNHKKFDSDYVLFQDIFTAYYYYKQFGNTDKKTILVLHCEKDIFGQFKLLFPGIFNSRYKKQIEDIFHFALSKVGKVVFVSEKSAVFNRNILKDPDFVHNGIPDLPDFNLGVSDKNMINFVCVGTFNYNKGQDVLIEAVNLLTKNLKERCRFYFVGDGPQLLELKNKVNSYKLNENIIFLGLRKDVPDLLKSMDVLFLLSKTEGLPLSIIEGLRQGLYIIATDVGGISEMIGDGFGKLVERNSEKVAENIMLILNADIVNQNSKSLSREYFLSKFTLDGMISKYSLLFNSMDEYEN